MRLKTDCETQSKLNIELFDRFQKSKIVQDNPQEKSDPDQFSPTGRQGLNCSEQALLF